MKLKKIFSSIAAVALVAIIGCTSNPSNNLVDQDQLTSDQLQAFSAGSDKGVVQIKLKDMKKDLIDLSTKSFDLFGINKSNKTVRARITKAQREYLVSKGFTISEFSENGMDKGSSLLPGYMTADQMAAKIQDLAKQFPDIVTVTEIGKTWEKRGILAINITNKKVTSGKFESLFIGGMHARELAPPEIMFKLADTLARGYGKDQALTDLVNTRDINIIPIVNVDGRVQVEKGNAWQRKNTHGSGVDLNRNFDSYWNYKGLNVPSSWVGDATNTSSETYSGTAPASEPEVQAIQNFYTNRHINMFLDMHSYGEMAFYPVGYSDKDVPEVAAFKELYSHTNFKDLNYQIGTSMGLLYPTTATTDDYAYVKHHAFGLGMEVGQSFRPSYPEVETMWNNLKPGLLSLLKYNNKPLPGSKK